MIHILGSSGFVGSQLYHHLSEKESQIKGYSSSDCNLLSKSSIEDSLLVKPNDAIIMASSITRFNDNSLESMIKNISMVQNLSEFIEENTIAYFVFLSSPDVYGTNISGMISEKLPKNPEDHYACSKLFGEVILRECCFKNDVPLLTLRLSGAYGPKDHARSTINMLVESAILKKKIIIQGDGEDKRDYIHVKDVCKVIAKGIERKMQGELNVATGKSLSINEIVALISLSCPKQFSVEYVPIKETGKRRIKEMLYDITLLKKAFPEFCPISLEKGLKLYLKDINFFKRTLY